jgi:lysozyme family protein
VSNTAFDRAVNFVLAREGGYVNDPNDPGGETSLGITWPTLKDAIAAGVVTPGTTIKNIGVAQATAIYRARYWDLVRCDELPESIALALFDAAVNHGPRVAVRMLQNVLGVDPDGIVGHDTLEAARAADIPKTLIDLCGKRWDAYWASQGRDRFIRGWTQRLFRVLSEGITLAAAQEVA